MPIVGIVSCAVIRAASDVGDALEHEGEASGVLERVRVLEEALRVVEVLPWTR